MITTILLVLACVVLLVISILWYKDVNYYDKRIDKLLLENWYLNTDNINLKSEVERLRNIKRDE